MESFRRAVESGYGMEFDVQLTKDRIPVVFHDKTLERVCGRSGNIYDYTYEELKEICLFESKETIPLFTDVLNLVNGQVPLIIEIKIHEKYEEVCRYVDQVLRDYNGAYCIESFHPLAVWWYKKNHPQVIRGQLSCFFKGKEKIVTYLLTNFITKPDFIAYDHNYYNNLSRRICRKWYKSLSVAWTIKSQEELDRAKDEFDLFIFEGFRPIDN
jgi:glycerophosphoryl diester phosphodiesterase